MLQAFVGNEAADCQLVVWADADFAGSLRDSKSTTGAYLMLVGSKTFVPITWISKKQTAVSHSSTEAELISLDAGMRTEALPILSFWDTICQVFHPDRLPVGTGPRLPPKGYIVLANFSRSILIGYHQAYHLIAILQS